jgi:hypothetical protein
VSAPHFAAEIYFATKGWQTVALCITLSAAARLAAQAYSTPVDGELPSQVRITKRDGSRPSALA